MTVDLSIFKDYDIRGVYPTQINGEIFAAIAHGIVKKFSPKSVAIGRDMRLSGEELKNALANEFVSLGIDVYDMGLVGTEMMSFVAGSKQYDLVIMISASHNPPEYNGMKMTRKGAIPVSSDTGIYEIRDFLSQGKISKVHTPGTIHFIDVYKEWKEKLLSIVNTQAIKPLTIVCDGGNGMAGKLAPELYNELPITLKVLFPELDGSFPNHTPNPLIVENNRSLMQAVINTQADMGFAFDGDADRMFIIDDKGRFVSGTVTTAILARYYLQKAPGSTILYNAICGRIVPQTIEKYGGKSKRVRVGYSYIKAAMKDTNAIFCGEHSGHYFHRDYYNSESGVLTALMVMLLVSAQSKKLSELVDELDIYPSSGEINFTVSDIPKTVEAIRASHTDAESVDDLDGLSIWYKTYWINVRASKTEPLLRLNVEADSKDILIKQTEALVNQLTALGAKRK